MDSVDLRRLELQNFLPYRSATIGLPSTGLVFIAGPNNAGKTALLSAFDVVAGEKGTRNWRFAGASEPAKVQATFSLTDDERDEIITDSGSTAHRSLWLESSALQAVQLCFEEEADAMRVAEVRVSTQIGDGESLRTVARLDKDGGLSSADLGGVLRLVPGEAHWDHAGGMRRRAGRPPLADAVMMEQPAIAALWRRWAEAMYHFSGIRTGTQRQRQLADVAARLNPEGINLAECLLFQFSHGTAEWDEIQRVVREVLPGVGDLVTPVARSHVEAAFVDPVSGARRNLKDLGAGVEQILMTTYVGVTQPSGSVLLIEEPETNLHAAAERELLRHLTAWAKTRQIILSTHSTVFLDHAATIAEGTWVVTRDQGESTVRRADTDFSGVLRAMGVRLSDMLSAERLVLVEGETDAEIIQAWFPELVLTRRTAVVPLGGGDRAYQVEMIEKVFAAADALGRTIVFLRDADNLSERNRAKLRQLGRVKLLSRREIENYLLDQAAMAVVLGARENLGTSPDPRRIGELIEGSADLLQMVVVLKRVADELSPIRLVDRGTIRKIASSDGGLADLKAAVAEAVPLPEALAATVEQLWDKVDSAVSDEWTERKLEIAPGAEILEAVWQAHGAHYDKRRDGPRIAKAMQGPPAEIRQALSDVLA